MKYIVARCKGTGNRVAVVFSERVTHKDVFSGMRREFTAESAGFVYYDASAIFGIRVSGESESMHLKSDPGDTIVLSGVMGPSK